jgi:CheY-like chemotaxis protein
MDLSLPIIDGLAATRQIRNLPDGEDLPIVAVSAHDTADFHAEALAAGCNAYITKPIDYPQLEEIVQRLMAKSETRTSNS